MKYVIAAILVIGTVVVTWLALPKAVQDECCEYVGLLGPEDVSEVPGVEHAEIEAATVDGAMPATVPGLKIHDKAPAFDLPDLHGKAVRVDPSQEGITVVLWVSCLCPTSAVYEIRLNKLQRDYPKVHFYAINSAAMESVGELRDHFERKDADRLAMAVLKDDRNVMADAYGARVSTEAYVFDRNGLQYRGAIDDARNPARVTVSYLRQVLDDLGAGKAAQWRYQPPKGCCPIDRVQAHEAK